MGRFVTNRGDVEAGIRQGGDVEDGIKQGDWTVAFSKRELTETDFLELLVFLGTAIYTAQPEVLFDFLEELVAESIAGLGESIAETITPEERSRVENFAIARIKERLLGKSPGEDKDTVGGFDIKAGVAKFIGHNEEFNPLAHPERFPGDTGEFQQVGPGLVSFCPFVGIRLRSGAQQEPGPTPKPSPAPPIFSATGETRMIAFIKDEESPLVFVTDGITKRPLALPEQQQMLTKMFTFGVFSPGFFQFTDYPQPPGLTVEEQLQRYKDFIASISDED